MRTRVLFGIAGLALPLPAGASASTTTARQVLSQPGQVSRWAFVDHTAVVRQTPDPQAKAVSRLRLRTQDGTDELVLALERETDEAGSAWVRVRLPVLPNNTTG